MYQNINIVAMNITFIAVAMSSSCTVFHRYTTLNGCTPGPSGFSDASKIHKYLQYMVHITCRSPAYLKNVVVIVFEDDEKCLQVAPIVRIVKKQPRHKKPVIRKRQGSAKVREFMCKLRRRYILTSTLGLSNACGPCSCGFGNTGNTDATSLF